MPESNLPSKGGNGRSKAWTTWQPVFVNGGYVSVSELPLQAVARYQIRERETRQILWSSGAREGRLRESALRQFQGWSGRDGGRPFNAEACDIRWRRTTRKEVQRAIQCWRRGKPEIARGQWFSWIPAEHLPAAIPNGVSGIFTLRHRETKACLETRGSTNGNLRRAILRNFSSWYDNGRVRHLVAREWEVRFKVLRPSLVRRYLFRAKSRRGRLPFTSPYGKWSQWYPATPSPPIPGEKCGVYRIREAGSKTVVYVGESHTYCLRRTLLDHFRDDILPDRGSIYTVPANYEVQWMILGPRRAKEVERQLIMRDTPRDNRKKFGRYLAEDFPDARKSKDDSAF